MDPEAPAKPAPRTPDQRRGKAGRDLAKQGIVGETEPLTFRVPKAWKRVLRNMVDATEERAFAASQPELAGPWNESVMARKVFFRGYQKVVEEHALNWLRRGVALQHVVELTDMDEGYLALLVGPHGITVVTAAIWPPRTPAPASSEVEVSESSPAQERSAPSADQLAQLERILV